ncbi:hypothetical protein BH09VER1_BH09VER1_49200 [soil metagenome]
MRDDLNQEPVTLHDLTELSREKLGLARDGANGALAATAGYIRANPWTAVAGAALLGVALVALSRRGLEPRRLKVVRGWLDDAREKLPTQREVSSFAESTGVPCLLKQLGKKLHLVT